MKEPGVATFIQPIHPTPSRLEGFHSTVNWFHKEPLFLKNSCVKGSIIGSTSLSNGSIMNPLVSKNSCVKGSNIEPSEMVPCGTLKGFQIYTNVLNPLWFYIELFVGRV